jgi:hypothetical protein
MRGRRYGESLFDWSIVRGLWWFRQVTHDENSEFAKLPPRSENHFKGHTRRLST